MAEPVALKYRAFISYSHADTGYRGLEGFRIDEDLVGRKTALGAIPRTRRPLRHCDPRKGPNPNRRWMDRHWLGDGR